LVEPVVPAQVEGIAIGRIMPIAVRQVRSG
jgi:hypothetical protein